MTPAAEAPWYQVWFDHDTYDLVYARRDRQEARRAVDLIVETLGLPAGSLYVDVACGRGRHAVELARHGYRVVGTDLSERALEHARRLAARTHTDVTLVRQDMREPYCAGCADAVVNLFTAFGYFEDEADHLRALQAMAQTIRPGGAFVQDFLNAPHVAAHLVPHSARQEDDLTIEERRWIAGGRVNKEITLHRADGAAHTFRESVRLFTRTELESLYAACGLRVVRAFGDYEGAPHTNTSPRLMLVAERVEQAR